MRVPSLSARDRRAALFGLPVLAAALFWTLAARPYLRALDEVSARLTAEQELLSREVGVLAVADRYPEAIERGTERLLQAASRLFGGGEPGVASANLARYLQEMARESPALLARLELASGEPAGTGLMALPLHVQGETDLEGLLTLLHSLESGPKLVRVEELRIQGVRSRGSSAANEPEVLSFDFRATGFMLTTLEDDPDRASPIIEVADG